MPAVQIRPLPEGVDTKAGALAEPLAVAMHAVRRAGPVAGRDVLVNGAGPIGSLVVAAARFAGARSIGVADINRAALEAARAMGADTVCNAAGEALPERELVFEASGPPVPWAPRSGPPRAAAQSSRSGTCRGLPSRRLSVIWSPGEITWAGSYRFVDEIDEALSALHAGLDLSPLMTHSFDVVDAEKAMEVAGDSTSGSSKVMLSFGQ